MNAFQFRDPVWLLLLIPVIGSGLLSIRRDRNSTVLYSNVELLKGLPVTLAQQLKRFLPWLKIVGLTLIVLALARPQSGREEFRIRTEGIAIEMCIDRSGSMRALDFPVDREQVNRLAAVKRVFHQFVAGEGDFDGRPNDLIGLVAFGGFADAKCPPTLDHGALLDILDTVEIPEPIVDKQGRIINEQLWQEEQATAIGDAIAVGVDRLKDIKSKSRVILLLSDGENTAGVVQPEEAANAAAEFGIRIYTIGVGTTGMAPYPTTDAFGRNILRAQPVRLDEDSLKMLSQKTGGRYFNAQNAEALTEVYAEIDRLEKTETEGRVYTEYREMFQWLMLPGLGFVLLQVVLAATRFRGLP